MDLNIFLTKLKTTPLLVEFHDTMDVITYNYEFEPTAFQNGQLKNNSGQNNGSCKLFSFARQHQLTVQETLDCFGTYYRNDVLQHPDADDHQNIRNFIKHGWEGISFDHEPLKKKS